MRVCRPRTARTANRPQAPGRERGATPVGAAVAPDPGPQPHGPGPDLPACGGVVLVQAPHRHAVYDTIAWPRSSRWSPVWSRLGGRVPTVDHLCGPGPGGMEPAHPLGPRWRVWPPRGERPCPQ